MTEVSEAFRGRNEWRKMIAAAAREHGDPASMVHGPWWFEFANFQRDMGNPPCGKTLKRHDKSRAFCPDNCYWG